MTSGRPGASLTPAWPFAAVPPLAFLLILPLLLHGPSCGHDFGFHMQSWMDASDQMRHGVLFPHWAYSTAFNAGEPRFIFYPPLSWWLGSLLFLALPVALAPAAFTFVALTLAGWGMVALARRYTGPGGALLTAGLYLSNPYMLFTAFERTAYAELLAAAWLPWLVRAALAEEPSTLAIALPLALLWLTNAPAAVMGTYALVFLLLWRLLAHTRRHLEAQTGFLGLDLPLAYAGAGGLLLGLALSAFYLIPAAWERRYVQIAMAIIPNMRVEDNFLFGHTGYGPHDAVLHTASLVALTLLGATAVALGAAWWRTRPGAPTTAAQGPHAPRRTAHALAALSALIAFLVLHASLPVWHLLPELAFLQFPWRWMAVLGCLFGAATAVSLGPMRLPAAAALPLAVVLAGVASPAALHPFREGCEAHELPADRLALYATHHGVGPTDEYTPGDADNDQLRWDDPPWWLANTPNAPGPGTVPNPAATIENYDEPPPLEQTVSGRAPAQLHLHLDRPQILVLNLRDFPAWAVRVNGVPPSQHLQRDDGLLALSLPAGDSTVDVHWRTLPAVYAGEALSLCALLAALGIVFRRVESNTGHDH